MEHTKRRDRWTPGEKKDGKYSRLPLTRPLTANDERILQTLLRYQLLRENWLYALCPTGKDRTHFKKRLRYLYDIGMVERPTQGNRTVVAFRRPLIYRLSDRGFEYVRAKGFTDKPRRESITLFAHQLATCEVIADVELALRGNPTMRFLSKEDLLARAPQATRDSKYPFSLPVTIAHDGMRETTHYVSDGWFGIEYTTGDRKRYAWFALEINHGTNVNNYKTLKAPSHLKKFLSLEALRKSNTFINHFGIKAPVFGLFVQAEAHVTDNSKRLLAEVVKGDTRHYFAFKTLPPFYEIAPAPQPNGNTLKVPWETITDEPFRMNQP